MLFTSGEIGAKTAFGGVFSNQPNRKIHESLALGGEIDTHCVCVATEKTCKVGWRGGGDTGGNGARRVGKGRGLGDKQRGKTVESRSNF